MNLVPLLTTSPVIQLHLIAAFAAFCLGTVQLILTKGSLQHCLFGYIWVGITAVVALSSFFIYQLRLWGPFSPIHLLSLFTLFTLFLAIQAARAGNIMRHKWMMLSLYLFALLLAGAFTFWPGRLLHEVFIQNF